MEKSWSHYVTLNTAHKNKICYKNKTIKFDQTQALQKKLSPEQGHWFTGEVEIKDISCYHVVGSFRAIRGVFLRPDQRDQE